MGKNRTFFSGQVPPDRPACGFDGSDCDYTLYFALLGFFSVIVLCGPLSYFVYLKQSVAA